MNLKITKYVLVYIIAHKGNCLDLTCENCGLFGLCTSRETIQLTKDWRNYLLDYCTTMYDTEYGINNIKKDIVELLI